MNIIYSSSVDGDGFRDTLFTAGCRHHCPGCHNPTTWDIDHGQFRTINWIYEHLTKSEITNVTISGGEPLEQPYALLELLTQIKTNTKKTVWLYTGFTIDELFECEYDSFLYEKILKCVDVLVDGPFVLSKRDDDLVFKGSTNQRLIDMPKTFKSQSIVLYEPEIA